MRRLNNYGISELTGFILTLTIVTVSVSFITYWGATYIEETKSVIIQQSTLIQLDTIIELIADLTHQGNGSCGSIKLQLEDATISSKNFSERFVIYYPTYSLQPFLFDVTDFNPGVDENNFTIKIRAIPESSDLTFDFYRYAPNNDGNIGSDVINGADEPNEYEINCADSDGLTGVIEITISDQTVVPPVEYGKIWIIDIGLINFKMTSGSTPSQLIIENSAVFQEKGIGIYTEPKTWTENLLNGSKMVTLGISNIKLNNLISVGSLGLLDVKLYVDFNDSIFLCKNPVYNEIGLMIYGAEDIIDNWFYYYKNQMAFEQYTNDFNDDMLIKFCPIVFIDYFFSLNYFEYLVTIEVV